MARRIAPTFAALLAALAVFAVGSGSVHVLHLASHASAATVDEQASPTSGRSCRSDSCQHRPDAPQPPHGERLPEERHDAHGCGVCVLLASLAAPPTPADRLDDTLVRIAIVEPPAPRVIADPSPLEVPAARPPPAC